MRWLKGAKKDQPDAVDGPDEPAPEPSAGDDVAAEPGSWGSHDRAWFLDHYEGAARQIVEFLDGGGVSMAGRRVADIGCGDGIIDLGLVHLAKPARLIGYDLRPTDPGTLLAIAERHGVADRLPAELEFSESQIDKVPAPDESFDVVISWSAFEHVGEPVSMFTEIRRILQPQGVLFLQLWPFYFSERGSHLWEWFPQGFHHLLARDEDIVDAVRNANRHPPDVTEYMLDEFRQLNRITADELQRSMLAGGLAVRRFELLSNVVHLPAAAQRYPLTDLGITGIKLIATRF
jgi:ubiquinone/menaquinone biosynthesis C-methylase UbiE